MIGIIYGVMVFMAFVVSLVAFVFAIVVGRPYDIKTQRWNAIFDGALCALCIVLTILALPAGKAVWSIIWALVAILSGLNVKLLLDRIKRLERFDAFRRYYDVVLQPWDEYNNEIIDVDYEEVKEPAPTPHLESTEDKK